MTAPEESGPECRAYVPIEALAVALPCLHPQPCPVHDWTEPDWRGDQ